MNDIHSKKPVNQGIVQFSAGASLVVSSGLLNWDAGLRQFATGHHADFERHWTGFNKVYGRAAMWNIFSTGAELMLKGFLIKKGELAAEPKKVLAWPANKNLGDWALQTLKTPYQKRPTQPAYGYGTISGALTNFRKYKRLDTAAKLNALPAATPDVFVAAAYELLRDSIRNRDTHAYVPNVRAKHEWLANGVFMKAFNTLLGDLDAQDRATISNAVVDSCPAP